MSLRELKVQNFKLKKFYYTKEENEADIEVYNDLSKKIDILNSNINRLKNNFSEYKDAKNMMLKQYSLLRAIEKKFYKDIFNVGKTKALGYLPKTYFNEKGRDINYFIEFAIDNSLEFYICNRFDNPTIVVYHKKWLEALLYSNKEVVQESGLSLNADEFVEFVMEYDDVDYDKNTELYILIAMAFNVPRLDKVK